jgi:ATP-dependent Zn protease
MLEEIAKAVLEQETLDEAEFVELMDKVRQNRGS